MQFYNKYQYKFAFKMRIYIGIGYKIACLGGQDFLIWYNSVNKYAIKIYAGTCSKAPA